MKEKTCIDAVSMEVHKQVQWERDCAIEQLEEHGLSFGRKADATDNNVGCKWIPVTERLPECGVIVMVYDKEHGIYFSHRLYSHLQEKPFVCEYSGGWNVTHWMPLPMPPKEGE